MSKKCYFKRAILSRGLIEHFLKTAESFQGFFFLFTFTGYSFEYIFWTIYVLETWSNLQYSKIDMISPKTLLFPLWSLKETAFILILVNVKGGFRIKILTLLKKRIFLSKLRIWSHLLKKSLTENFIYVQYGIYKPTLIFRLFRSLNSWMRSQSFAKQKGHTGATSTLGYSVRL